MQELLSDSGLGREMHVIVGQGQLDSVLQATPEDRRGFIEEAAGILKHRRRKEKTLRKLEAMEANLTRLSDLAGEIRRQLKPLGRQAEVAREAATIAAVVRDATARLLADELVGLAPSPRRARPQRAGAARRAARAAGAARATHQARVERLEAQQRAEARRRGARASRSRSSGCRSACAALYSLAGQRIALLGDAPERRRSLAEHHGLAGDDRRAPVPRSTRSREGSAMPQDAAARGTRARRSRARAPNSTPLDDGASPRRAPLVSEHDMRLSRSRGSADAAASALAAVRGGGDAPAARARGRARAPRARRRPRSPASSPRLDAGEGSAAESTRRTSAPSAT